jgi:sulfhydrogenase subunit beta (sulfur reductase)
MKTQKILSGETMEKILTKKALPQWVKKLESYRIYAPLKNGDLWNYEVIDQPEDINLDYLNTVLSPKKLIFPQRETFLEFSTSNDGNLEIKEVLPEENPSVIFGVRPCDAKALTLTDKVFGGEFEDLYYWKRRNQAILVGLACNTPPSPNCFCLSVNGSPHSKEGLDILMTDLGDRYYVESLTEKGNKLINLAKKLFEEPKAKDKKDLEKVHLDSEKKIKRQIKEIKKIPPKLKGMFDSPFWDEEAMSCIRCGVCTYLCPTCHCFDISDEVTSSSPLEGKRVRTWDTCQFPDFTMHSSGHNPRPDKASRLRQRILHKFQYFVEKYKNYQCTGCGRCISKCPVGIDIIEVLDKVRDYEE